MRRSLRKEKGQSLVLVALCAVGLAAILALVLDAGYAFAQRREIQNAADAAALAGSRALSAGVPVSVAGRQALDAQVLAAVQAYGTLNAPRNGISVAGVYVATNSTVLGNVGAGETPPESRGVMVSASTTFPSFFMSVLGINSSTVSAPAMAKHANPVSGGTWAIWAGGRGDCSSGLINYNADATIDGSIHSNANAKIGGNSSIINGTVEAVNSVQYNPAKVTINSAVPYPIDDDDPDPDPMQFNIADFRPGGPVAAVIGGAYHSIAGDLDDSYVVGGVLAPGLYYVTGNVRFSGGVNATGVTIVSEGDMKFSGSANVFTRYQPGGDPCLIGGLLLFSNSVTPNLCSGGGDAIEFSGSLNRFEGIVYAPRGRIKLSGSQNGSQYIGMLIGLAADISGSGFTLQARMDCPIPGVYANYIVR